MLVWEGGSPNNSIETVYWDEIVISVIVDQVPRKEEENRGRKQNLHQWVKVDQAFRPLPSKTLSILIGLAWKTDIYVQSQLSRLETSERFGLF